MGEEIAQFDAIAEVGGCVNPEFELRSAHQLAAYRCG